MITDCPRCGRPQSAWDGEFCGRCEEAYRREEEQRLRVEYDDLRRRSAHLVPGRQAASGLARASRKSKGHDLPPAL